MKRRAFLKGLSAGGIFVPQIIRAQTWPYTYSDPQMYAKVMANLVHPLATSWATRVVTNGGAAPSLASVATLSNFAYALDAAGLTSSFLALNCFAPDSLIACITPLIITYGGAAWTSTGFFSYDVTANGLTGDGVTKRLNTWVTGANFPSSDNAGVTLYASAASNAPANRDIGFTDYTGSNAIYMAVNEGGNFGGYLPSSANVISGTTQGPGYYSLNRVSSTDLRMYYAKSSSAHAQIGATGTTSDTTAFAAYNIYVFCQFLWNTGGTYGNSINRLSFVALHSGFSAAQSASFYSAVQALRTALGGGYV